jgi:hypothetical protein
MLVISPLTTVTVLRSTVVKLPLAPVSKAIVFLVDPVVIVKYKLSVVNSNDPASGVVSEVPLVS